MYRKRVGRNLFRIFTTPFGAVLLALFPISAIPAQAVDYYVSPAGNDSNSGLSINQAWATIGRVNQAQFHAGDNIYFEGGRTFNGNITLDSLDSGVSGNPVTLSSYSSASGSRAEIYAGNGTGISIYNAGGIRITNLKFRGSGDRVNQGKGISAYNDPLRSV